MTMEGNSEEGRRAAGWFDPRLALVVYVRVLAVIFIVSGLRRWGIVLGPLAPNGDFLSLPVHLVVATAFFAVCDLVAAVGLWLLSSWGVVVWLIAALTEAALHSVFRKTFGVDVPLIAFHLISVAIYGGLMLVYERKRDV